MSNRALAEKLITNFGTLLTLPELKLDDVSNSCVLLFDGDIVLNIEYDDTTSQVILSSYLDELPAEGSEAVLRELMIANLYWHRTDGATLGLEDATNGIILAQSRSVTELDDATFEKLVETFVNQTERWKGKLAAGKHGNEATTGASDGVAVMPQGLPSGARIFG